LLLRQAFKLLRGVKLNLTDVRLSFMEDVLCRGDDRRMASVIGTA